MSTAEIVLRPSSSTVCGPRVIEPTRETITGPRGYLLRSGIRGRLPAATVSPQSEINWHWGPNAICATVSEYHYDTAEKDKTAEESKTAPPPTVRFAHEVMRFQRTVGRERDTARSAIVNRVLEADSPDEFIWTTIRTLVSSARPGRLDDAIDILSECGPLLPQFVGEFLSQPESSEIDEDYWYVLIRGIGKSTLPSAPMFVCSLCSKSPEAAVEALGDIGDEESLTRLRAVADSDSPELIRELAAEILEERTE